MSESTILVAVQLPVEPIDLEPVIDLASRTGWPVRLFPTLT